MPNDPDFDAPDFPDDPALVAAEEAEIEALAAAVHVSDDPFGF